jgi:hypothetical protein
MKCSSIGYSVFLFIFYVSRNDNVLYLRQYHCFMIMKMLLLPEIAEATFLLLMQASKPVIWALKYFHMLVAFFVQIMADIDAMSFYLTYVYLIYIQGSKSSTEIVIYSQSQSFTGFPEQEFNNEDWNAKAAAIGEMGDDSTPLDSRQETSDDAQRAPDDGQTANGGAELPEVVIADVVGEKAANVETKSAANQQVQHLNHFLFISVISFFSISIIFLHCFSIKFLEALLAIRLVVLRGR